MSKKTTTPEPVAVTTICSVCGLGWELHGDKPTTDDCIQLLKAELARRPIIINNPPTRYYPVTIPYPTYPTPAPRWQSPIWYGTGINSSSGQQSLNVSYNTPETSTSTCSPVTS